MRPGTFRGEILRRCILPAASLLLPWCPPQAIGAPETSIATKFSPADRAAVVELRGQLLALSSKVDATEAQRVAERAHMRSRELARTYRVVGPPLFHNFLVNTGMRKRGLCFHWARDLVATLDAMSLKTLELHWGAARPGTWREHNCVVVTAKGQPFEEGIILDSWRHSGRLFFARVRADHYPWKEDKTEPLHLTRTNTVVGAPLPGR